MPRRSILLLLFLVSGAASLIYQVLWTRHLTLTFGSSMLAVSAVVTAFMTGLALGGWILGRRADCSAHPLRLYAAIECGIAACAVLLPFAVRAMAGVNPFLHEIGRQAPAVIPLARLVLAFALLLIPCTLIGGTLPVLVRFAARTPETFGKDFGLLYGMNTLGAVCGTLVAGFWLIGAFGLRATNFAAVAANLALAAGFYILDRKWTSPAPAPSASATAPLPFDRDEKATVIVALLSGFTLLALEVLWTRALVHALLSTTFSFTAVLATLLLALAAGSLLATRVSPEGSGSVRGLLARLAVTELCFAALLLLELPTFGHLVYMNLYYDQALHAPLLGKFLTAAALLFLPALAGGMLFPLSVRVLQSRLARVGESLGRFYLWNTLASAVGSLAAGFVLIPLLGVKNSYLALIALHVSVAVWLGLRTSRNIAWMAAAILLLGAAVGGGRWISQPDLFGDPALRIPELQMELLAYKEAPDATFAVYRHKTSDSRFLYINGFVAASAERASHYMPMMGHLPLLLHPAPRRALVIAFGTGSTAGAATLHPIEHLDIVDISREPLHFAPYFFATNFNVLQDRRVHTFIEDGRNYVEAAREQYDVITSEPMPPKFAHMVNFYTREYYAAARKRLTPSGLLCQWLPFHLMTEEDARRITATFLGVFPHAQLWVIRGTGLLVGSPAPMRVSASALASRLQNPRVHEALSRIELGAVEALLKTYALDAAGLQQFSALRPAMTDNLPYLEFSSDQPYHMRTSSLPVYEEIRALRRAHPPVVLP